MLKDNFFRLRLHYVLIRELHFLKSLLKLPLQPKDKLWPAKLQSEKIILNRVNKNIDTFFHHAVVSL